MTINPDDFLGYEDAPISDNEPTCPQCQSTYVKFIKYMPCPGNPLDMGQLYLCNVCSETFIIPMTDIPF